MPVLIKVEKNLRILMESLCMFPKCFIFAGTINMARLHPR